MDSFSQDINNLIDYVNDVKPYHSKLTQVNEEIVFGDRSKISILENISVTISKADGSNIKIDF